MSPASGREHETQAGKLVSSLTLSAGAWTGRRLGCREADPAGRRGMRRAVWNGAVLAESGDTVRLDYFPAESLKAEFFTDSSHTSVCPWKGQARYYDVEVAGRRNP